MPRRFAGRHRRSAGPAPRDRFLGSNTAAPITAPAMDAPFDVLLVALKGRVLRRAPFLHRGIEAFAGVGGLLHLVRQLSHEGNLLLHVLSRAAQAARSGM